MGTWDRTSCRGEGTAQTAAVEQVQRDSDAVDVEPLEPVRATQLAGAARTRGKG